jgi:hypothetical protein
MHHRCVLDSFCDCVCVLGGGGGVAVCGRGIALLPVSGLQQLLRLTRLLTDCLELKPADGGAAAASIQLPRLLCYWPQTHHIARRRHHPP